MEVLAGLALACTAAEEDKVSLLFDLLRVGDNHFNEVMHVHYPTLAQPLHASSHHLTSPHPPLPLTPD